MKNFYFKSLLLSAILYSSTLLAQDIIPVPGGLKGCRLSQKQGILSLGSKLTTTGAGTFSQATPPPPPDNNIAYEYFERQSGGMNLPTDAISDGMGNMYITGTSSSETAPNGNIFTICVNAAGEMLWSAREEGADYTEEAGYTITLDPSGNPIVAGNHWNGHDMDIKIIKYKKETGEVLWSTIFGGGDEGLDIPTDIIVDTNGNVLVTGGSYSYNAVNYVTLKLDNQGDILWSVTDEAETVEVWSEPVGIAADNNGNVIVTGYSVTDDETEYYYTIKYDSNGELQWKKNYEYVALSDPEDPDSELVAVNAHPVGVAVDSDGNSYVTGVLGGMHIGTVKYAPDGEEEWVKEHMSGTDISVSTSILVLDNMIYVSGYHYGDWENEGLVLLSYTPEGTLNWEKETNNFNSVGYVDLLTSTMGNPVIAIYGETQQYAGVILIEHSEAGEMVSTITCPLPLSPLGGVMGFVGAGAINATDYHIACYGYYTDKGQVYEYAKITAGSQNNPQWISSYSNSGASLTTLSMAEGDGLGNTYAMANYTMMEEGAPMVTGKLAFVKYDNVGAVEWSKIFEDADFGFGCFVIDNHGDILVLLNGNNNNVGATPTHNIWLKKYSPDGSLVWETQKEIFFPSFGKLSIDNQNNIYLVGTARQNADDAFNIYNIIRYSSAGQELWSNFYPTNDEGNFYAIENAAVDSNNNLIFTGAAGYATWFNQNFGAFTTSIAADGTLNWQLGAVIEGTTAMGTDIFIDEADAVFITGSTSDLEGGTSELFFSKLNSDGTSVWNSTYSENGSHIPYSILPDADGGFLLVGDSYLPVYEGTAVRHVAQYSADGSQEWIAYSEPGYYFEDCFIDNAGNTYVLNRLKIDAFPYRPAAGGVNAARLMIVNPDGEVTYDMFEGPAYAQFYPKTLSRGADDTMLIGGTLSHELYPFGGVYFMGTEIDQNLGIPDFPTQSLPKNWLGQNYPNPSSGNEIVKIPFSISEAGLVNITLYDTTGRLVKKLFEEVCSDGMTTVNANVSGLVKGIYIYKLDAKGYTESRKMVIK